MVIFFMIEYKKMSNLWYKMMMLRYYPKMKVPLQHRTVKTMKEEKQKPVKILDKKVTQASIKELIKIQNNNNKKKNNKRYNICNSKNKKYEKMLRSLQNAEIIVVRKPNSHHIDHYLESRPCNDCVKMMKKIGIKKVHYSNEDGKMITEKVNVMDYKHNTPGNVRYKKNLFK